MKRRFIKIIGILMMFCIAVMLTACSEAEGYMSISNNITNELVITVKTGENSYKKNYVYLNEYTMYAVEDITGTHTDPYHYKLYWHTHEGVSVEVK